jgi:hypothetical protein
MGDTGLRLRMAFASESQLSPLAHVDEAYSLEDCCRDENGIDESE